MGVEGREANRTRRCYSCRDCVSVPARSGFLAKIRNAIALAKVKASRCGIFKDSSVTACDPEARVDARVSW